MYMLNAFMVLFVNQWFINKQLSAVSSINR